VLGFWDRILPRAKAEHDSRSRFGVELVGFLHPLQLRAVTHESPLGWRRIAVYVERGSRASNRSTRIYVPLADAFADHAGVGLLYRASNDNAPTEAEAFAVGLRSRLVRYSPSIGRGARWLVAVIRVAWSGSGCSPSGSTQV